MNILRVIASMDPSHGGPGQGIRNSVPELIKLGIYNEVVCLDDPEAPFLKNESFIVRAVGPAIGPWQYSPKLKPWLINNLERFDVVIVHGIWLYHGYSVRKVIKYLRAKSRIGNNAQVKVPKLFFMPHGMLDPYFQHAKGRKFKALRNWIYWKLVESRVINSADGLLFTCEAELKLARKPFAPYCPKRELNVGYGIANPPAYNSLMYKAFKKKCPQIGDSSYLLFLSRIHEKKGIDILINAYAHVLNKHKSSDDELLNRRNDKGQAESNYDISSFPKLIVAGPGLDTPFGQFVQNLVNKNCVLHNMILFPGMLAGDTKWGALYGCEAFVLPSHQENFGIAVVEALACSKPVLITKQINIWREIVANKGGVVVNDTVEDIEEMLRIWSRMSYYDVKLMGQQARTVFEKNFAIAPSVVSLLEAIK